MNDLSDYDFPMCYDHYRALCFMYGKQVPPKLGNLYLPSEEEHRQSFARITELWRNGIYPALHENVDELYNQMVTGYLSKEKVVIKPAEHVLTHQPMYKKQDNSNSGVGRGLMVGGGVIESGKPKRKGRLVATE